MSCFICQSKNPYWLLLKNDGIKTDIENNNIGETVQTCSYSCTQKMNNHFTKKYSDLVLNKEDFCYWAVPVKKAENIFEILSFEELQKMDVFQKENYNLKLKEYCQNNNKNYEMYEQNYIEDENTYNIENEMSTDEELKEDDY
jgi:hypothetical protein